MSLNIRLRLTTKKQRWVSTAILNYCFTFWAWLSRVEGLIASRLTFWLMIQQSQSSLDEILWVQVRHVMEQSRNLNRCCWSRKKWPILQSRGPQRPQARNNDPLFLLLWCFQLAPARQALFVVLQEDLPSLLEVLSRWWSQPKRSLLRSFY